MLLLPLPLLVTKLRNLIIGFVLSLFVTIGLTLYIPERVSMFRFVPFDPWIERTIICIQLFLYQLAIYALKETIVQGIKKRKMKIS